LSSSTVIELVRITVLVVGGSTVVALGIDGMGLDSCAQSMPGPARQAMAAMVKVQVLMRLQAFPY
jgi:hypothetical protein